MTKKHFIALADTIKEHNAKAADSGRTDLWPPFELRHLQPLADFCQSQNPRFDRERWLGYRAAIRVTARLNYPALFEEAS